MKRWIYYHWLAISDLFRLWSTTQHHVIIVSGICLPILLLLGLKSGHVADLRKDLVTSPTARQVVFWSAQQGELMDAEAITRLQETLPSVDLIIPEVQRIVDLSFAAPDGRVSSAPGITLYATRPGDPILAQAGVDVLQTDEPALVLSDALARTLQAKAGETVTLSAVRQGGDGIKESASTALRVKAIYTTGSDESQIAYAESAVLDKIEAYVRGYRVKEFGWPARKESAPDTYQGYLVFCERTNDLTEQDREALRASGYTLEELELDKLTEFAPLLLREKTSALRVYRIATADSIAGVRGLRSSPSEFSQMTDADDVVLPWNPPCDVPLTEGHGVLVGLSLPKRSWLRSYLTDPALAFDYEAPEFSFRSVPRASADVLHVRLSSGADVPLTQLGDARPSASDTVSGGQGSPVAIPVPVNLLAHLTAARSGHVSYDAETRLFAPKPERPVYNKARLYARTIDNIPAVVRALTNRHFAIMSENARITEIQHQDRSLKLLVAIVGVGVFLFGVIVVVSVLLDSTDRKRGVIGILRVMGVSGPGIFYLVLLRATVIGILAGGVSVGAGYLIAITLHWVPPAGSFLAAWKPVVSLIIQVETIAIVLAGAFVCCALGSLIPAWWASRLDPFDAIVEGRFR